MKAWYRDEPRNLRIEAIWKKVENEAKSYEWARAWVKCLKYYSETSCLRPPLWRSFWYNKCFTTFSSFGSCSLACTAGDVSRIEFSSLRACRACISCPLSEWGHIWRWRRDEEWRVAASGQAFLDRWRLPILPSSIMRGQRGRVQAGAQVMKMMSLSDWVP